MKVKQILNRIYVNDMEQTINFYEKLLNEKCNMIFQYAQANLELAQISNILIICGPDDALKIVNDTKLTFLVDSVKEYKDFLLKNGVAVIRDIKEVPTGFNMTVKHLDGTIVEYVEHKNN